MKTYIKFPSAKGNYQDAEGNKFLLIEETPTTFASLAYARLEGEDATAAATAGDLELIPEPPAPATPVPYRVSPRQLRLALLSVGVDPANIVTAINAIPDPAQKAGAMVEWEYAIWFERNHVLITSLAGALGLTSDDVDNIFRIAVTK